MSLQTPIVPKTDRPFTLNFVPSTLRAHGVLRLILSMQGEQVTRTDTHRAVTSRN
jgi:NADH:ubiquinone oxidoreductase subunit D